MVSKKELIGHIRDDVEYPATKTAILEACNNMEHLPKADRDWVAKSLPDRTFKTAY